MIDTEKQLRNTIINRIMLMPKAKLIQIDSFTKNIELEKSTYNPEFVEKVLSAFNEEGRELTEELEIELFGE